MRTPEKPCKKHFGEILKNGNLCKFNCKSFRMFRTLRSASGLMSIFMRDDDDDDGLGETLLLC